MFLSTLETMLRKTKRPVVFTVSGLSKIRLIQTENLEVGEVDFLRQSTVRKLSFPTIFSFTIQVYIPDRCCVLHSVTVPRGKRCNGEQSRD